MTNNETPELGNSDAANFAARWDVPMGDALTIQNAPHVKGLPFCMTCCDWHNVDEVHSA